jgi:hypothetical protein
MKIRTRHLYAGLALLAGTFATATVAAPQASAGGLLRATPGDGSAVVYIAPTGFPGLTNGMKYNSSGGAIDAGRVDATHFWVSFAGIGGGTYTNAQISMWHGSGAPAIDPVCTIDTTKDTGADVTVWFECNAHPFAASLVGAAMFITVTDAPHPDRLGAVAPSFFALTSSDPSIAVHTPLNQYRSSGSGQATVTRNAAGQYSVRIPNAAYPKGSGIVVATALTVNPAADPISSRYCNPQNWAPNGADMVVNVNCYNGVGVAADGRFSVRLSSRTHTGGSQPGGSQWVSDPASAGYDAVGYGWNSTGGANHVAATAVGVSEVRFRGATGQPLLVKSVLVSAYGGNQRCSLTVIGIDPVAGELFSRVRCVEPMNGGVVANGRYTVSIAQF